MIPQNIRQDQPAGVIPDGADITIEDDDGVDKPVTDDAGNILTIEHGDGSVTVSLDGSPLKTAKQDTPTGWFENLAGKISQDERSRIAEDLLRGIRDDLQSRQEWIEDRANGIKLLGLKIEIPGLQGASDGAPVEGMSKVRHPLLLEATLRFWANSDAELLPADGPVKVSNDDNNATADEDEQANNLGKDLNHYLTAIDKDYYPDTSRMLLHTGFGGLGLKKVYFCPLRMRPVSDSVEADDLIVNNSATSLKTAKRITHRINMRPSTVKRMQILGVYRDVDLSTPLQPSLDSVQREEKAQQGLAPESSNPEDRDRELYECYCELDISGFEHKIKGEASGLEIPYKVTIDVSSREILEITRNYDEETKDLPEARTNFVAFIYVPGFGFYPIGLLHILGNTTNAVTAAWREMLDNGMYANFPGFLIAKSASRQNSSILRVPPGGSAQVDLNGMDSIQKAVMPLPYQTAGMPALMSLVENMTETGRSVGSTSEVQVGEGRQDAPVGTTLALIEQAVKIMAAAHKGLCTSQAEEFALIVKCFKDHPESFLSRKCEWPSGTQWNEQTFMAAISNCKLVPKADPNTSSNMQRMMKIVALKQLQAGNPSAYNPLAIDRAAIRAIGFSNPDEFLAPPQAQQQPPPELQQMMAKMQNEAKVANAKTQEAQAKMALAQAKLQEIQNKMKQGEQPDTASMLAAVAKLMDAENDQKQMHLEAARAQTEDQNRDLDRASHDRNHVLSLAQQLVTHLHKNPIGAVKEARAAESDA